ncbi:hypothetical protein [Haloechinothrix salitolerans]|uniref:Uncharacterized protein n=1 Tax=Haloechinothrix salitolerans TaxID=926830 RepID=A0ABW2C7V0_9PSEU
MTASHDTSQSDPSAAEVPTVSFSHSTPDDQVDYDQLNEAGAPGADDLHMPFTAPPAHLAPTDPPTQPRSSSRPQARRDGNSRRGGSRRQSSSRSPRRH